MTSKMTDLDMPRQLTNNATETPPELVALSDDLSALSSQLKAIQLELPQLVRFVQCAIEGGCEVSLDDTGIQITSNGYAAESPLTNLQIALAQLLYSSLQRHLSKSFALQRSLQNQFAELPTAIISKLPSKSGSPWRSFYLRECLDVLHMWPLEVENYLPFLSGEINVAGLVRAARPRSSRQGFPFQQRFQGFTVALEEAISEIGSLRFEFGPPASTNADLAAVDITGTTEDTSPETLDDIVEEGHRYKPDPSTLRVIRCIQKGHSNEKVQQRLNKQKGFKEVSIPNIRTIRSRLKNNRFIL